MYLCLQQLRRDLKKIRKEKEKNLEFRLTVLGKVEQARFKLKTLSKLGVSERTYYRWKKRYLEKGVEGLRDKPGRGSKRRKNVIRGGLASKIKFYRKQYAWGAEVIAAHINPEREVPITQYEITKFLKRHGLIVTRKRKGKSKHNKKVVVKEPGKFTQLDVKHLTELHPSHRAYAYNFVDHASKWSYKEVFDSYGPSETHLFMSKVIKLAPFKIEMVQTDNGIEFTFRYVSDPLEPKKHALDELCEEHDIRHKLIPPGVKELNGLVERHHRIDNEEFYRRQRGYFLEAINKRLRKHCSWRNSQRRFKALGWKTPEEYLRDYNNIQVEVKNDEKQYVRAA